MPTTALAGKKKCTVTPTIWNLTSQNQNQQLQKIQQFNQNPHHGKKPTHASTQMRFYSHESHPLLFYFNYTGDTYGTPTLHITNIIHNCSNLHNISTHFMKINI